MKQNLLCELHCHTELSDGKMSLSNTINLYGKHGFDVLAITDHVVDTVTLKKCTCKNFVAENEFQRYLEKIWRETQRAWDEFNMLVIPGLEITNSDRLFHILAIDIKEYISPDLQVTQILEEIKRQDALSIAAHPGRKISEGINALENSYYLWHHRNNLADKFNAWEIANRYDLYNDISQKKFPFVASGDFHKKEHIYSWKTVLHCEKNIESIKQTIKENKNVFLTYFREK